MLFSDRTSTHYLRSNQLRLYFSSIAYVLAQVAEDRRFDSHHGTQGVCRWPVGTPTSRCSSKSMKSSAPFR
jgi:hypothetical protein